MSEKPIKISPANQAAAALAEEILSPAYRDASAAAFADATKAIPAGAWEDTTADIPESVFRAIDTVHTQEETAQSIIYRAVRARIPAGEKQWEQRRQAALAECTGQGVGKFGNYFATLEGQSEPSTLTMQDLPPAERPIIMTNSRILNLEERTNDPMEFMEDALAVIESRRRMSTTHNLNVGPGNYATAIKIFADKFARVPEDRIDQEEVTGLISRTMDGYLKAAREYPTNFVEIGNICNAVRNLPQGSFDKKFTMPLLRHALDQLPDFTEINLRLFFAAMAKLDLSETGNTAAAMLDLALRKTSSFETTRDMRRAIRAIANLPPSTAANKTFETFLTYRNNLEEPLDIAGLHDLSEQLVKITHGVISDPTLSAEAKTVAEKSAYLAVGLIRREKMVGEITTAELGSHEQLVRLIVANYRKI